MFHCSCLVQVQLLARLCPGHIYLCLCCWEGKLSEMFSAGVVPFECLDIGTGSVQVGTQAKVAFSCCFGTGKASNVEEV